MFTADENLPCELHHCKLPFLIIYFYFSCARSGSYNVCFLGSNVSFSLSFYKEPALCMDFSGIEFYTINDQKRSEAFKKSGIPFAKTPFGSRPSLVYFTRDFFDSLQEKRRSEDAFDTAPKRRRPSVSKVKVLLV